MANTVRVEFAGKQYDGVPVEVNQSNEHWNQYLLEDGTMLRLKSVVTHVVRVPGEYTPEGDPLYIVKSGNIVTTTCPENLKRK